MDTNELNNYVDAYLVISDKPKEGYIRFNLTQYVGVAEGFSLDKFKQLIDDFHEAINKPKREEIEALKNSVIAGIEKYPERLKKTVFSSNEELRKYVEEGFAERIKSSEFNIFDGNHHSYISLGHIGDSEQAMKFMALTAACGLTVIESPKTTNHDITEENYDKRVWGGRFYIVDANSERGREVAKLNKMADEKEATHEIGKPSCSKFRYNAHILTDYKERPAIANIQKYMRNHLVITDEPVKDSIFFFSKHFSLKEGFDNKEFLNLISGEIKGYNNVTLNVLEGNLHSSEQLDLWLGGGGTKLVVTAVLAKICVIKSPRTADIAVGKREYYDLVRTGGLCIVSAESDIGKKTEEMNKEGRNKITQINSIIASLTEAAQKGSPQ